MTIHSDVTHLRATHNADITSEAPVASPGQTTSSQYLTQIWNPADVSPNVDLSDEDLLILVLSCGGRRPTAQQAVSRLLDQFLDFERIIAASPSDLAYFGGLSAPEILALKSIHIAALRVVRTSIDKRPVLSNRKKLHEYLIASLARKRAEGLCVLFLDSANHLIADEVIATGSANSVSICIRDLVLRALRWNATAIILAHNHPSGDPSPSLSDVLKTHEVIEATAIFDITVHDHVIVTMSEVYSLKENGLLPDVRPYARST